MRGMISAACRAIATSTALTRKTVYAPLSGDWLIGRLPKGRGAGRGNRERSVQRFRRVDLRKWGGQDSNLQPDRYERVETDMVAEIGWCAEEGVSDPKLIQSALSRTIPRRGTEVRIDIYRLETTDWSLEVVDETARPQFGMISSYRSGSTRRGAENDPRKKGSGHFLVETVMISV